MQPTSPPLRLLLLLLLPRLLRAAPTGTGRLGSPQGASVQVGARSLPFAEREDKVQALVGSGVALPCVYPQRASFELHSLYVYWQITVAGKPRPVAWYVGGSTEGQDGCEQRPGCEWRAGAKLLLADMQRGNFTLRLANVSLQDEQSFQCLVFKDMNKILECRVQLLVGASYSMPVVTPQEAAADGELVFTCTSSNGYPEPKVYWVNETDGSLLDPSLYNRTVQLNARGLYDVLSVLRLGHAGPTRVGCCLENEVLHENVSSRRPEKSQGFSTTPRPPEGTSKSTLVLLAVGMVIGVGIAVATGWMCRNNCVPGRYTGVQEARPALQLFDPGEAAAAQSD